MSQFPESNPYESPYSYGATSGKTYLLEQARAKVNLPAIFMLILAPLGMILFGVDLYFRAVTDPADNPFLNNMQGDPAARRGADFRASLARFVWELRPTESLFHLEIGARNRIWRQLRAAKSAGPTSMRGPGSVPADPPFVRFDDDAIQYELTAMHPSLQRTIGPLPPNELGNRHVFRHDSRFVVAVAWRSRVAAPNVKTCYRRIADELPRRSGHRCGRIASDFPQRGSARPSEDGVGNLFNVQLIGRRLKRHKSGPREGGAKLRPTAGEFGFQRPLGSYLASREQEVVQSGH